MNKYNNYFYKGEFITMKQYADFKAEKTASGRELLPVGGYVCEIKRAKEESYSWGSRLVLAIEVIEGEYAGFWKRDFDNNTRDDKKWRGIFRINCPTDDGSEQDSWTKRKFGNFIWAVQESNPGYVWNWDEKTLKGKKIGLIYRNFEWEMDGKTGWSTEAGGAISVDDCRNGKFKLLKDRPLKDRPVQSQADASAPDTVEDESDLPF